MIRSMARYVSALDMSGSPTTPTEAPALKTVLKIKRSEIRSAFDCFSYLWQSKHA